MKAITKIANTAIKSVNMTKKMANSVSEEARVLVGKPQSEREEQLQKLHRKMAVTLTKSVMVNAAMTVATTYGVGAMVAGARVIHTGVKARNAALAVKGLMGVTAGAALVASASVTNDEALAHLSEEMSESHTEAIILKDEKDLEEIQDRIATLKAAMA